MSKRSIQVVYPLGIRCFTELMTQRLGLKKFSSIFGSLNIHTPQNIAHCFETGMDILLNKKYHLRPKNEKKFNRTLHYVFDDITDPHSATFAHYDFNNQEHVDHFNRGVKRLNFIKEHSVSVLFIILSGDKEEVDITLKDERLIAALRDSGFTNMHLAAFNLNKKNFKESEVYRDPFYSIYNIYSMGYRDFTGGQARAEDSPHKKECVHDAPIYKILTDHFDFSSLLEVGDLVYT